VGNLQVGGAGKTPLVAAAARELLARGKSVGVLTRGYGGSWERTGGTLAPGGSPVSAEDAGDEALLLRDLVPGVWIGVGADRQAAFDGIVRERGGKPPDVVLLDDGFQHHKLKRDAEIVALTSHRPWSTLFRDWPRAADRATAAVWTKGAVAPVGWEKVEGSRRVRARLVPMVRSGTGESVGGTRQTPALWLITGVADGVSVRESLEAQGVRVRKHVRFRDHARYDGQVINDIMADATAAGCAVGVTGKDWVKWRDLIPPQRWGAIRVFEPAVEIVEGRKAWEEALWG
jgi:tetraacyldisaccharide 4'-kinase